MLDIRCEEVKKQLNQVFRDVFDNPAIEINESMTAKDIEGWDSLTHVNLIVAVEKRFKISVSTKDVSALRNVGDFLQLILKKIA